jgi:hypothetical protein
VPPDQQVAERKKRFNDVNIYIATHGVLGSHEVTLECLPGSSLPGDLRVLGYGLRRIGEGERILQHQIVERFVRRADGELEPLTEGSTKPGAETRTYARIVKVERFSFKAG